MSPKPKHLGPEYASQFQDASVVHAYHRRPPYPDEVFNILGGLTPEQPGVVLDAGCGGMGDLARGLVGRVKRIDAVDFSHGMIESGRKLPGGDHPSLRWILGSVEDAVLYPPYSLVTAGQSLHWMEWSVVLPRFRRMLVRGGLVAIVNRAPLPPPWSDELGGITRRFSTNRDRQPYDLVTELQTRGLFEKVGEKRASPVPFAQPLDDYVESFHSSDGFSRERMTPEAARAFDDEVSRLVSGATPGGLLRMELVATIVWGVPRG